MCLDDFTEVNQCMSPCACTYCIVCEQPSVLTLITCVVCVNQAWEIFVGQV